MPLQVVVNLLKSESSYHLLQSGSGEKYRNVIFKALFLLLLIKYIHLWDHPHNYDGKFSVDYDLLYILAFYDYTAVFAQHYETVLIKGDIVDRKYIGYVSVFLEELCFYVGDTSPRCPADRA